MQRQQFKRHGGVWEDLASIMTILRSWMRFLLVIKIITITQSDWLSCYTPIGGHMYLCRYRCTYSMRYTYIHTYIYVCLLMCFSLYNFLFVQIGLYAASLIRIGHVLKFILAPPPRAARPPLRLIVVIESRLVGSFREFFSHRRSHVAYFVAHLFIDHVLVLVLWSAAFSIFVHISLFLFDLSALAV